jgi:TPR repeat protein
MRVWKIIWCLAVVALFVSAARAGPIEDAEAAIKGRDYATALRIIRPLAEQGDPNAQYTLGVLYQNGLGVPQDRVSAYAWLSLAASRGRENAAAIRDLGARLMSSSEIDEGKKRVEEWNRKPTSR